MHQNTQYINDINAAAEPECGREQGCLYFDRKSNRLQLRPILRKK